MYGYYPNLLKPEFDTGTAQHNLRPKTKNLCEAFNM